MVIKALLVCALAIVLASAQKRELACNGQIDLAFVFDSSSSIGSENFLLVQEFAQSIVEGLNISQAATRVGVVRFTSWAQMSFTFNRYSTSEEVHNGIGGVEYYGKGTYIYSGLMVTAQELLQRHNGWREGNVPTVVIVITEGMSQEASLVPAAARALKAKATRVLAIGIGAVNVSELRIVASSPSSDNIILLSAFSELGEASRVSEALTKTCEALMM